MDFCHLLPAVLVFANEAIGSELVEEVAKGLWTIRLHNPSEKVDDLLRRDAVGKALPFFAVARLGDDPPSLTGRGRDFRAHERRRQLGVALLDGVPDFGLQPLQGRPEHGVNRYPSALVDAS